MLLIIAVAALLCVVLGYLVARMSGTASAVVSFIAGAACVALVLILTPYGQNPTEVLGLGTAWIVAGGMGAASVGSRTDSRARINWRTWFFGTLLAAGTGLGALVLQHATGAG